MKFLSVLALIFITLKLLEIITWSWWLVLLPLYGGAVLWIIFVAIVVGLAMAGVSGIGITRRR